MSPLLLVPYRTNSSFVFVVLPSSMVVTSCAVLAKCGELSGESGPLIFGFVSAYSFDLQKPQSGKCFQNHGSNHMSNQNRFLSEMDISINFCFLFLRTSPSQFLEHPVLVERGPDVAVPQLEGVARLKHVDLLEWRHLRVFLYHTQQ